MGRFRELVLKMHLPITLEAPLIRRYEDIDAFTRLFKKHDLDKKVVGINILNNPLGRISADPLITGYIIQQRTGVEAIPHIVPSVENRYTFTRWLIGGSLLDINNLLLVGGDVKIEGSLSYDDALNVLNEFSIGEIYTDNGVIRIPPKKFFLGGVIIPWRDDEYLRINYKLGKSIEFFQTQIILDFEEYEKFIFSLDKSVKPNGRYKLPILTGLVSTLDKKVVEILMRSSILPEYLYKKYRSNYDKYLEKVIDTLSNLSEKMINIKLGLHIMPIVWEQNTLNRILIFLEKIGFC